MRCARLTGVAAGAALVLAGSLLAGPTYADTARPTPDHDLGTMGSGARVMTVSVDPAAGPNFQLPFRCGQGWTGTSRPSHSPSPLAIDFNRGGDYGQPALASARGVVSTSAVASGYGNYVVVSHGGGYSTLYAHLRQRDVVVGQVVDQGSTIGWVGDTGNVTGPHLHFEERRNGAYFKPYFNRRVFTFGSSLTSADCPDVPVTGDWNGDGRTDVGVDRATSTNAQFRLLTGRTTTVVGYYSPPAVPVIGDWNGDRTAQLGVRGPHSTSFLLRGPLGGHFRANMGGLARDLPISGRWTLASPKAGIGYVDPATHVISYRDPAGVIRTVTFGKSGELPVTGDWDGNGVTDFGGFAPATATWRLRSADGTVQRLVFGATGDRPVTGDWNGDHRTDLGVWHPATATFTLRTTATARSASVTTQVVFGRRR